MPNGDQNWGVKEYPKLEAFFAQISSILEDFATRRNLNIAKYYHQFPGWHFRFRHPKGGFAYVSVEMANEQDIHISGVWWLDDKTKYTRLLKWADRKTCSINNPKTILLGEIDAMFLKIISWNREELSGKPDQPSYRDLWERKRSKKEIEFEEKEYPVPHID